MSFEFNSIRNRSEITGRCMMKREIKIDYYDKFNCIADKCSFTCCQEWKIAVDEDTYTKWKNLSIANQKNQYFSVPKIFFKYP